MKRFAAILCLMTLAWNISLASVGGMLICSHEDGNEHWVTPVAKADTPNDECCHHDEHSQLAGSTEEAECHPCEDVEVNSPDLDDATANAQRIALKAPIAIECAIFALEPLLSTPNYTLKSHPLRAPSLIQSATREFTHSIRINC